MKVFRQSLTNQMIGVDLTHHEWTDRAQLRAGLISYARSAGGGRRHVLPELLREHDVVELAREQPLLLTEELICMRSVMAVVAAAMAARGPARGGALRRPARTVCSAAAAQTDPARRAGSAPSEREERAALAFECVRRRASSAVARARWPAGAARGARQLQREQELHTEHAPRGRRLGSRAKDVGRSGSLWRGDWARTDAR